MAGLYRVLLSFAALCVVCLAQSQSPAGDQQPTAKDSKQPTPLHLVTVESVTATSEVATGFADLVCDGDGNLFLGSESPSVPGIRKLSPKGELTALFQPNANPDVQVMGAGSFSVAEDGEVYLWVGSKNEITRYVLVFKPDGSYKTRIKLQPGFPWVPASIAVFPNGTLLMTGQEYDKDIHQAMWAFTGIFSADGTLLKEVNLEDDQAIHDMTAAHDPRVTSSRNPTSDRAVSWGRMEAARDGNIYVMRWESPAIFYAVSPGGEVVRRFTVDSGNSDFTPVEMHISGNQIAVLFVQHQSMERIMKVVDLEGHEIATYKELSADGKPKPGAIGIAFACYDSKRERFTFLATGDNEKIQLKFAEAR